jgi:hypothetical protein
MLIMLRTGKVDLPQPDISNVVQGVAILFL